jgi:hypothetical protein
VQCASYLPDAIAVHGATAQAMSNIGHGGAADVTEGAPSHAWT